MPSRDQRRRISNGAIVHYHSTDDKGIVWYADAGSAQLVPEHETLHLTQKAKPLANEVAAAVAKGMS